jgi:hypothetical protein
VKHGNWLVWLSPVTAPRTAESAFRNASQTDPREPTFIRLWAERMAMDHPRLCTAKRVTGGKRCGAYAIRGGTVCMRHGGCLPQVRAKANQRLDFVKSIALAQIAGGANECDSTRVGVDRSIFIRMASCFQIDPLRTV